MRSAQLFLLLSLSGACGSDELPDGPNDVPFGSLLVRWSLIDELGAPLDCHAVGLIAAEVAIGGAPRSVDCAQGSQLFERLLPDRYPVFVRMQIQGVSVIEGRTNAIVEAGKQAVAEVQLVFKGSAAGQGAIRVRWVVGGDLARRGCAAIGASSMQLTSGPTSRAPFDRSAACGDGEAVVVDIPSGVYEVVASLRDAEGGSVVTNTIPSVLVVAGETAEPPVLDMFLPAFQLGTILARWTVSGTVADAGCAQLGGQSVLLRLVQRVEASTSTSCAAGRLRLGGIRPDDDLAVDVLMLAEPDPVTRIEPVVTSTRVAHVRVLAGRTTTIGVDLKGL
ncbi:MAG: hypothetical protein HYV07_16110 [Deltaproteobacteria bacterium]|nr:hypothetical protein [Deltaproteobacteria bacterium]